MPLDEGYSDFTADKQAACPLSSLVMHESRMNVSIGTKIPGTIELTDECMKYGLGKSFPTFTFRNYTIIRDGVVNVSTIPVSMSEASFNSLQANKAISAKEKWESGRIYDVCLNALPVMNRAMADGKRSAQRLCSDLAATYQSEGRIKALKYFLKQLDPDGDSKKAESLLLPEAVDYLSTCGVGRNGYSPKRIQEEPTDTYFAREFIVRAKGMSSLPKVEDVITRLNDGKPLSVSAEFVNEGILEYRKLADKFGGVKLIKELNSAIAKENSTLRQLRAGIQKAKFAILLGNQWFEEFSSREGNKLCVGKLEFSFEVKETVEKC